MQRENSEEKYGKGKEPHDLQDVCWRRRRERYAWKRKRETEKCEEEQGVFVV